MKFTTILPTNHVYNISVFSEYIVEKAQHFCVIEYDSNDIKNIFKLLYDSIIDSEEKEYYKSDSTIEAFGDDGNTYHLKIDSFTKIEGVNSKKKYIKLVKKADKYESKMHLSVDKFLNETTKTIIKKKFTLAPFKKYIFISKEHNIAFSFRIKPSKDINQPILMYFHGGGCCGLKGVYPYSEYMHFGPVVKSKKHNCTVIIPQFPYKWFRKNKDFNNYLAAVKQLSEIICKEYTGDKNRIYIFGCSFGGFCTWSSAYRYPEHYACAIPIMGGISLFEGAIDYSRFKDMPIWVAHSSDDMGVSIDSDDKSVEEISKISSKINYTRWDKYGHSMAPIFLKSENWDEWMFNQSLDKR